MMEREEIISRMNALSYSLHERAQSLMGQGDPALDLSANVMTAIADCIDEAFCDVRSDNHGDDA